MQVPSDVARGDTSPNEVLPASDGALVENDDARYGSTKIPERRKGEGGMAGGLTNASLDFIANYFVG